MSSFLEYFGYFLAAFAGVMAGSGLWVLGVIVLLTSLGIIIVSSLKED